jgi:hypothetical protein
VVLLGCASLQDYSLESHERVSTATYSPRPDDCVIEVFELDSPEEADAVTDVSEMVNRPYDTVERFELTGANSSVSLKGPAQTLACRAGGDAIVFQRLPDAYDGRGFTDVGLIGGSQSVISSASSVRYPRARVWVIKFQ